MKSNNLPEKLALTCHRTSSLNTKLIFIYYKQYLMHVFGSLLKFSQVFFYNFVNLATVFSSMLFFKKEQLRISIVQ